MNYIENRSSLEIKWLSQTPAFILYHHCKGLVLGYLILKEHEDSEAFLFFIVNLHTHWNPELSTRKRDQAIPREWEEKEKGKSRISTLECQHHQTDLVAYREGLRLGVSMSHERLLFVGIQDCSLKATCKMIFVP